MGGAKEKPPRKLHPVPEKRIAQNPDSPLCYVHCVNSYLFPHTHTQTQKNGFQMYFILQ